MRLRVSFYPPINSDDFDNALEILQSREKNPQKNKSGNWLRQHILRGGLIHPALARAALASPVFNAWAEKTVFQYKVEAFDRGKMTIDYDFNSSPVALESLQMVFDVGKRFSKTSDILELIRVAQQKMFRDGAQKLGYPKECIIVERI